MKRKWWLWLSLFLVCLTIVFVVSELTGVSIGSIFGWGTLGILGILGIIVTLMVGAVFVILPITMLVKILLECFISNKEMLYMTLGSLGFCAILVGWILTIRGSGWSFLIMMVGFSMGCFAGAEYQGHKLECEKLEHELEQAAAAARETTEQDPDCPGGWFNLGLIEEHRGRYREALNCYQRAAELAPGSAVIISATGRAYAQLGNANRAIASLTEALQLRDDPANAYLLGRVALLTGDLPLAERLTRQLLESPESAYQAWGHTLEGTILRVVDESLEPAAEHFQTALSLCPSNLHAAHSLTGTLLALGRLDEAKDVAAALAALQPHSLRVVNRMGEIAHRQKSWQEAERWFQRAERLQVFPQLTAYNVASVYAARGNNEQAVRWCRLALTRDASFLPAHVRLAQMLDDQGRWRLALYHLHQALQIDPGDQLAYRRLAQLWQDQGRFDRAEQIALRYDLHDAPGQS